MNEIPFRLRQLPGAVRLVQQRGDRAGREVPVAIDVVVAALGSDLEMCGDHLVDTRWGLKQ